MKETPKGVRGTVERLFYTSPTFTAGVLRTPARDRVSFAGALMVKDGDAIVLYGRWETHKQYGKQLKVERFEFDQSLDREGLANYLAKHPGLKGIGPVKARAIAKWYGDDFSKHLADNPKGVAKTAGVPLETILALRDEWSRSTAFNQAAAWLSAFGLTHHQVNTLVKKYGNAAITVLHENPYLLVREIRGMGFKRVDQIALKMGVPKDNVNRLRAGIQNTVTTELDNGHCWTEYAELVDEANRLLIMDDLNARERVESSLDELIDSGALTCVSHGGRFLIARTDIHTMETAITKCLHTFASKHNPHFGDRDHPDSLIDRLAPDLNAGQRLAVLNCLHNRISVITGGAGSGKTYTIDTLCKLYRSHNLNVILAAPTGKAAKRMEQATGMEAFTLHRLLGYDGMSFAKGPDVRVLADVMIIDEMSMVDVPLMWQLLQALDLDRTTLVLVGDHNQLPPVGPGSVLADTLSQGLAPTVRLDEVVRQAGVLKRNCIAVLSGDLPKTARSDNEAGTAGPWYLLNRYTDAEQVRSLILEMFDHVLQEKLGYDLIGNVQLLTPTRKGPLGVDALNADLQRLIQRKLWRVDVPPVSGKRRPRPLLKDKIIQRRNNYDLGVMNGAIGQVIAVDRKSGDLRVRFDDRTVTLQVSEGHLNDIQLAYALTIHQSQGSEFDCAVLVVHKAHAFMHHRNLLYTGVTRARKTAILVGDRWGMRNCATRLREGKRRTFLSLGLDSS